VLLYSHDSYGLGHLSRTLAIAGALREILPDASLRVLSGSPRPEVFARPGGCELTLLPPITKDINGRYVDRAGRVSPREIHLRRGEVALRAALDFRPDLFLVDHAPAGAGKELLPALRALRGLRPECRLVYGMRDIIDEPSVVRRRFRDDGTVRLLREAYDSILVYGAPDVFDPVRAYDLPEEVASKIVFTGYLGRGFDLPALTVAGTVLVTPGGGEDGAELLESYLRDMRQLPAAAVPPSLLVAGPFLPPGEFRWLEGLAVPLPNVRIRRYMPELQREMSRADLVVCRAGYNTLCEALTLRRRVLVVPRSRYRKEQPLRALILSQRGLVDALLEHPVPAGALGDRVLDILGRSYPLPRRDAASLPLDGLRTAAEALAVQIGGQRGRAAEAV
jgi:predicted glycosyltransferase